MDFKYKTESLNKKIIDLDTEILEIIYPNIKILNEMPKYQWYKTFDDLRRLSLDEIIYITDKIITNKKDITTINKNIDKMKKLNKKLADIMLKMKINGRRL